MVHLDHRSCTMYCLCTASDACHNPFTNKEDEMEDAAPNNNYDHEHENDRDEQDEDEDDRLAD